MIASDLSGVVGWFGTISKWSDLESIPTVGYLRWLSVVRGLTPGRKSVLTVIHPRWRVAEFSAWCSFAFHLPSSVIAGLYQRFAFLAYSLVSRARSSSSLVPLPRLFLFLTRPSISENIMDPVKVPLPWYVRSLSSNVCSNMVRRLIQFKLVDGRDRVVEEESVQKVVVDRNSKFSFDLAAIGSCAHLSLPELSRIIESAAREIQELRDMNHDKPNMPQDVKVLIGLCRTYRLESLEHKYRCLRLVEYILELHCVHGTHGSLQSLPPVPPEITWYLDTRALEC